ncbi:hypothetical protein D3C75_677910 [compost metagenome]
MQPGRHQQPVAEAVKERPEAAQGKQKFPNPAKQLLNPRADSHDDSRQEDGGHAGYQRHKPRASKKLDIFGKLDKPEAPVAQGGQYPDQDTAENPQLHGAAGKPLGYFRKHKIGQHR